MFPYDSKDFVLFFLVAHENNNGGELFPTVGMEIFIFLECMLNNPPDNWHFTVDPPPFPKKGCFFCFFLGGDGVLG